MTHAFPKQITQTVYLTAWASEPNRLSLSTHPVGNNLRAAGMLEYGSIEITVDVPDDLRDPNDVYLESLYAERDASEAKHRAAMSEINDRIQRLQAITYNPEG